MGPLFINLLSKGKSGEASYPAEAYLRLESIAPSIVFLSGLGTYRQKKRSSDRF